MTQRTFPLALPALAATAALATMAVLAPQASATLRVESTTAGGLVLRDTEGTTADRVTLIRFLNPNGTSAWQVFSADGVDPGPGCVFLALSESFAACDRRSANVTVTLLGGDDQFTIPDSSLPIADPLNINVGAGNDTAEGAAGADSLQGGSGNDSLRGEGGNDVLNGSIGNDLLRPGVGADTVNAGEGDDSIRLATTARDGTDQVQGGIGVDTATYSDEPSGSAGDRLSALRIIEANLQTLAGEKETDENDLLTSIERYGGGAGPDIITGVLSSNAGLYNGGLANDQLFGTSGTNTLVGAAGQDQLVGKAGNDTLDGKSGESAAETDSRVDCGDGTADRAIVDLTDAQTVGCENTDRSAIGERPHVRPSSPKLVRIAGGRVSVRLSCPRAVSVDLGALSVGVRRRTVAQLVSVERGDVKGVKTTLRRIVLKGSA